MKGAKEIYDYLPQGVCGRLFIDKSYHARGKTLRIYVLPKGDWEDIDIHTIKDAVEVYGITGGLPGWTEKYGWLHKGPWVDDVKRIIKDNKERIKRENEYYNKVAKEREKAEKERINKLLSDY